MMPEVGKSIVRNSLRMVLIVFHVELFFQATVKPGGEGLKGKGFPGMLASFTRAINEGLIQKHCLFSISEEVCHQ